MVDNYNMAVRNKGDIAKSIVFLRYEDLSLEYEGFAEEIYEKFKLGDFNEAVENLQKSKSINYSILNKSKFAILWSHGEQVPTLRSKNFLMIIFFTGELLVGAYYLHIPSWRMVDKESSGSQYASQLEILDVQQKCSEFMKTFGY